MLKLLFVLAISGCVTDANYARFKPSTMCLGGPSTLFRDANLGICWITSGKQVITADCDKLNRITYCPAPKEPEKTEEKKPEVKKAPPKK